MAGKRDPSQAAWLEDSSGEIAVSHVLQLDVKGNRSTEAVARDIEADGARSLANFATPEAAWTSLADRCLPACASALARAASGKGGSDKHKTMASLHTPQSEIDYTGFYKGDPEIAAIVARQYARDFAAFDFEAHAV